MSASHRIRWSVPRPSWPSEPLLTKAEVKDGWRLCADPACDAWVKGCQHAHRKESAA